MVSNPEFANSLTVQNASSAHYTLAVMSVVAAICVPLVLLYQGWTYHVFRARVGGGTGSGTAGVVGDPPTA
jgi:cytochrome bd ubiquinol oxidase subunit II